MKRNKITIKSIVKSRNTGKVIHETIETTGDISIEILGLQNNQSYFLPNEVYPRQCKLWNLFYNKQDNMIILEWIGE